MAGLSAKLCFACRHLQTRYGGIELPALIALARGGCYAVSELAEADGLVRAYQDSPGRAAMLATLTQLRHTP